jgi:hypothetical protein
MRTASRTALASVAMLLVVALGGAACSGDDEPDRETSGELPSGDPTTFEIETVTTIGKVVGRLGRDDRRRLSRHVTPVVQRWFERAYVGGEYPRSNFRDAFPGFTVGARHAARQDLDLMTNKRIGPRISGVTPKQSQVWLDVLAVGKRAAAVTARFRLAFRTQGEVSRRVAVRGRLMLTRAGPGWRIFGYDVARSNA